MAHHVPEDGPSTGSISRQEEDSYYNELVISIQRSLALAMLVNSNAPEVTTRVALAGPDIIHLRSHMLPAKLVYYVQCAQHLDTETPRVDETPRLDNFQNGYSFMSWSHSMAHLDYSVLSSPFLIRPCMFN
jgi:hypothetical protein